MDFVSLNRAIVWIDTGKLHIFAEIVAAIVAKETLLAGDTRFDGDTVPRLKVRYTFTTLQHNTCCFMTDDTVVFKDQRMDSAGLPEVEIGPYQIST